MKLLPEDERNAWYDFRDHVLGTPDETIPGCVSCSMSLGIEGLCCGGYRLWEKVPPLAKALVTKVIEAESKK